MPQTSASNEGQIRAANDRAKKDSDVEATIIRVLMANPEGRRWVWNQLAFCRVFIADEGTDPGRMAFDKGLRNYGLKLLKATTTHAPELYITMTKEQSGVKIEEEPADE